MKIAKLPTISKYKVKKVVQKLTETFGANLETIELIECIKYANST